MRKLVECVPNFSEGRRPEVLDAIVRAIGAVANVFLLGQELDADHNRAVVTLVGEPVAVKEALFRMIAKAAELLDLTVHTGEHPRIGATDVVPFVPVENVTMAECVQLAQELGQRVGDELRIPVYLYEAAATRPARQNLANVRQGQFEGLRAEIGVNPDRAPDYGPRRMHPTAGATAIGARFFLVAYNVNLDSQDVALAKRIAKQIRASSGGFPCVKALGFELKAKQSVQVSMNLTNYTVTSLAAVYSAIQTEAAQAGVAVLESELVGLIPREALTDAAVAFLKFRDFDRNQVLENRIAQVMSSDPSLVPSPRGEGWGEVEGDLEIRLADFLADLASGDPVPGGGSAAALAGALAGALARMVCHVTVGKPKYQAVAAELSAVQDRARQLQRRLSALLVEDSQAYAAVFAAYKLPKATVPEEATRNAAIQDALQIAARTPVDVMQQALDILKLTRMLAEKGNPNAITDLGCAVHLAQAALAGAELNVRINLKAIADQSFAARLAAEIAEIRQTAAELTQQVLAIVEAKIGK